MRLIFSFALLLVTAASFAQQSAPLPSASNPSQAAEQQAPVNLPDAPMQQTSGSAASLAQAASPSQTDNTQTVPLAHRQPKRILGIMPNYRAVSAGAIPPPPTPKEAFKIATNNSFDYSAFIFTGLTSMIAEGEDSHPQLGKGVPGFWAYSWRGFLDKTDGNYWVIFALPTVFHEDERYYARGKGPIMKRAVYAATRIFITPDYNGHNTINASELLGRGAAQGVSISYYPSQDRTASDLASKYAYSLLRDAATNTFREFWPDINAHVLHRHS